MEIGEGRSPPPPRPRGGVPERDAGELEICATTSAALSAAACFLCDDASLLRVIGGKLLRIADGVRDRGGDASAGMRSRGTRPAHDHASP